MRPQRTLPTDLESALARARYSEDRVKRLEKTLASAREGLLLGAFLSGHYRDRMISDIDQELPAELRK